MPQGSPSEGLRRLGDFELVRELGRGGMGVVYQARQVSLNRQVALKVLSGGLGLTPKAVQRFRREAEAAAKLHHTNIVPVLTSKSSRNWRSCSTPTIGLCAKCIGQQLARSNIHCGISSRRTSLPC